MCFLWRKASYSISVADVLVALSASPEYVAVIRRCADPEYVCFVNSLTTNHQLNRGRRSVVLSAVA